MFFNFILSHTFVLQMRRVLNKILLSIMIIAFTWVIIGDLVNMHMKLIYKKDLNKHNTYYTKSHKSDKKDYLFGSKIQKKAKDFGNTANNTFNFNISVNYTNVFIAEILNLKTNKLHSSLLLRGPPSLRV